MNDRRIQCKKIEVLLAQRGNLIQLIALFQLLIFQIILSPPQLGCRLCPGLCP
jgi:hypothetical protein